MNDPVHIHQEPVNVREMEKMGYHSSNVFYFRWFENSVIQIGKAAAISLRFNHLNWNPYGSKDGKFLLTIFKNQSFELGD